MFFVASHTKSSILRNSKLNTHTRTHARTHAHTHTHHHHHHHHQQQTAFRFSVLHGTHDGSFCQHRNDELITQVRRRCQQRGRSVQLVDRCTVFTAPVAGIYVFYAQLMKTADAGDWMHWVLDKAGTVLCMNHLNSSVSYDKPSCLATAQVQKGEHWCSSDDSTGAVIMFLMAVRCVRFLAILLLWTLESFLIFVYT